VYIRDNPTVVTYYFYHKTMSRSHRTGNGLLNYLVQCSVVDPNTITIKLNKLNKLSSKNLKIRQMLSSPLSYFIVGHFNKYKLYSKF